MTNLNTSSKSLP